MDETDILQAVKSLTDLDSVVETYDLKISVDNKGKVDIRLKFFDGKPQIIAVRKDEEKLLIADVLCLHRYVMFTHLTCTYMYLKVTIIVLLSYFYIYIFFFVGTNVCY